MWWKRSRTGRSPSRNSMSTTSKAKVTILRIYAIKRYFLCALAAVALCTPARAQVAAAPIVQRPENAENLHILVGHSVVIHTDPRLTRVLVGNPAVVTTTTTAPNEVVVTAAAAGSSSVVLWQENNESRIIEVFADLDVSALREATARAFPDEAIQVEAEEGRVLLTGTASSAAVADQIGKMRVP